MPEEVSSQVDVRQLSLRGLGAFTQLLASMSADNVVPLAVIQMSSLGNAFHISGKHAEKVPELLQRRSSTRLERLGLVVGWRKGDTASLMVQSMGGQAVSLLSVFLVNLFKPADVGSIAWELGHKILPRDQTVSSPAQLLDVAKLLASKLEILGFGNVLAYEATKLCQIYEQLGKPIPSGVLDPITTDSAVDLFYKLSRAFLEEALLLRVSGTRGMGIILGVFMMMFPQNTWVVVDDITVHRGLHKTIMFEFGNNTPDESTAIQLETVLGNSISQSLPIKIMPKIFENDDPYNTYRFEWSGCVANALQLAFIEAGLTCSDNLLTACCNLIVAIFTSTGDWSQGLIQQEINVLPRGGPIALLGPKPLQRIYQTCETIFHTTPSNGPPQDLGTAYSHLVQQFEYCLGSRVQCSCIGKYACNTSRGWVEVSGAASKTVKRCKFRILWDAVGMSLNQGFLCCFVNASKKTTLPSLPGAKLRFHSCSRAVPYINKTLFDHDYVLKTCQSLHRSILGLVGGELYVEHSNVVACCSGTSTIYPTPLRTLERSHDYSFLYELVDGQIQLNSRKYTLIRSASAPARQKASNPLVFREEAISPSSLGEHTDLLLTAKECLDCIEIRCRVQCSGLNIHLDLGKTIVASAGLEPSEPCEHSTRAVLEEKYNDNVMTTSVAAPLASTGRISIAQTRRNHTAQLLCCETGIRATVQEDCYLNCAYEQNKCDANMIIVG